MYLGNIIQKQVKTLVILYYLQLNTLFVLGQIRNKRVNILMVIVDDLRHLSEEDFNLPSIKHLVANGKSFKNSFAQQALCAPSRNSMLTGRRPDSLHLYDFYSYWRESVGNYTTIPQYFKENGYQTYSVGKVFHPGKSSNGTDDYPLSWSFEPFHPKTEKFDNKAKCINKKTNEWQWNLVCPVVVNKLFDKTLPDIESVEEAIRILKKTVDDPKPLFLAVGFHKPHINFRFPASYMRKVPKSSLKLPAMRHKPKLMPVVAWHPWMDVKSRDDIALLNITFPYGTMPKKWTKKIKRAYFAAALYIDDLVGRLLKFVDMENTIVVLTSDHGWSLGENGLWAKYSNFDVALRVPLIIKAPEKKPKAIKEPVELVDLFPTLVELAGLPDIPKCKSHDKRTLCFEGKSLIPLMEGESSEEFIAISQYPRPSVYPKENSDKPRLKDIKIMGYSIRTKRYRYTEWVGFKNTMFTIDWDTNYGTELYDHALDPDESKNMYLEPAYEGIMGDLSKLLRYKVDPTYKIN